MSRRFTYLVFVLLAAVCFVLILFTKPTTEFLFANAAGDCSGRSTFMYNALYNNPESADVVFFGSSQTMNGVNDSLLNTLGKHTFLNLGYCRYGRNLDYFFIENYCKEHQPKKIILEVRGTEDGNTHAVTPFFLPVGDIANSFATGNADVFRQLYNKWLCNLKFIRGEIFDNQLTMTKTPVTQGFWRNLEPANLGRLSAERSKDSINTKQETQNHEPLNRNSLFYFEKLKQLAAEKKIELYFLYLSRYGNLQKLPAQQNDYAKYGTVLIPPDSIFCDPYNFSNINHLNHQGASKLSLWILNHLEIQD